jgi:hypothetical protein
MKLSIFSALPACAVLVLSVPADVASGAPMPEPQFGANGFGKKGYGAGYGAKNENAVNAKIFGYSKGYNKANGYAKGIPRYRFFSTTLLMDLPHLRYFFSTSLGYGNNIAKKGVNAKGVGKKGFGNGGFGQFGGFGGKGKGYGFI